ncbi:unnamed protein product [Euphydryas editha]|uniref:Interferon-related developmental regulator N-terminal domain-containing protein n=1 Tax=Euphydryas editha TaxID=104508 RepID=A0AAU9T9E8_EUPED|nr:unnamed protein product [Euphydryas editha]
MASIFDSEEEVNQKKFEENDEEYFDDKDELETELDKLLQIKARLGDIQETQVMEYDAKDMIDKLERHLFVNYDTTFLTDYYNVLKNNNADVIKQINNTILSSIQQAVRRQRDDEKPFEEAEAILMAAWLSVAALCDMRSALAARTLQALLVVVGDEVTVSHVLATRKNMVRPDHG